MANIGYATLTVLPSMKGVQAKLGEQLGGPVAAAGDQAGKSLGGRLVSGVGKVLKVGALAVGAAAGAVLATSLTKGFGRLKAIEEAQAKMRGLGHDTKSVDAIMKNALASVKGTAFGLGEAATTAAGAVAAGIKPGAALERVLKSAANAAAAAGIGMDEMGAIYNKVASLGKAQNDSLQQVADKGIPIYQALADQLGVTTDQVFKMASAGKIGFTDFEKAMTKASGTVAEEMGKTFSGSWQNMMAALGRVGANLLSGVFPKIAPALQKLMAALGPIEDKAKAVGASIGEWLGKAVERIGPILSEIVGGLRAFAAAWAYNDGEITSSGFPGFMERVGYIARQVFGELIGGIRAFVAAWQYNDGEITSSGFPGFMERVGYIARQVFGELVGGIKAFAAAWIYNDGEVTSSGFPGFMERAGYIARQLFDFLRGTAIPALASFGGTALPIAVSALMKLGAALNATVGFFMKHTTVAKAAGVIVAGVAAAIAAAWVAQQVVAVRASIAQMMAWWKTAAAANTSATIQKKSLAQIAVGWTVTAAKSVAAAARSAAAWVTSTAQTIFVWSLYQIEAAKATAAAIASHARMAAATIAANAKMAAYVVAAQARTAAAVVASGVTAAASATASAARVVAGWVLMGVQSMIHAARMAAAWVIAMGPVGWVIAAVVGLVALIIANWDKVKKWTGAAWDWIVGKIKTAWEWVVGLFKRYHPVGIIISHWDKIKSATSAAWNAVKSFVSNAWNNITNAVSSGVSNVLGFVKSLPGKMVSALGNLGSLLYNKGRDLIQGLLNGATSLLSRIGSFFLDKVPAFIREPFKKALGIHSPSKVFAGYGKNIGEGVLVGIDAMRPRLDSAMRGLVAAPAVPAFAGGAVTAQVGATGGGVVQNIYPQPRQSEYEIATIASRQLAFGVRS